MTSPLQLTIIKQQYNAAGGAERFVERALAALSSRGVALSLVTRRWNASPDFNTFTCHPFYLGRTWRDIGFALCACRTVSRLPGGLVQSHERVPCCDIYRAGDGVHREWLHQRDRILGPAQRWLTRIHPYHRYVMHAEAKLFSSPRLKAVICNSRMVKDEIERHFRVDRGKLHVIYTGIDLSRFTPELATRHRNELRDTLGIPQDALLLLFVGAGYERKGLGTAIRSVARSAANTYLLVVGKDRKEASYVQLAREQGVADRVIFAGVASDVGPFYGAADALLLPTLYDPFANVVLEAMASGLPAITSQKCGAIDIIDHGRNGYIRDALDWQGIVSDIRTLGNPTLRREVAAAARATVESFSTDVMTSRLLELYETVMDNLATINDTGRPSD